MAINYSLSLLESDEEIKRRILKEVYKKINSFIVKRKAIAQIEIRKIVDFNIKKTQKYNALVNDRKIMFELGVPNIQQYVDLIIQKYVNNIILLNVITSSTPLLVVTFENDNILQNLAAQPEATIISEGGLVKWLEWILFNGTEPVVMGFKVKLGNYQSPKPSRTGGAIMVEKDGANWSVPSEIAGVESNNFLTQGLLAAEDDIQRILQLLAQDSDIVSGHI